MFPSSSYTGKPRARLTFAVFAVGVLGAGDALDLLQRHQVPAAAGHLEQVGILKVRVVLVLILALLLLKWEQLLC